MPIYYYSHVCVTASPFSSLNLDNGHLDAAASAYKFAPIFHFYSNGFGRVIVVQSTNVDINYNDKSIEVFISIVRYWITVCIKCAE